VFSFEKTNFPADFLASPPENHDFSNNHCLAAGRLKNAS
jgi:hypothetical protein